MRLVALTFALLLGAATDERKPVDALLVRPGEPVPATIEGQPVRLRVESGGLNRLTLTSATVARLALKPAPILGKASLRLAGRKEFVGHNRPLDFAIDGLAAKGRAFWFDAAELGNTDAVIGPWGLPQARVTFQLPGPGEGAELYRYPLRGDVNSLAVTVLTTSGKAVGIAFETEGRRTLPLVSAAFGALLAEQLDGHVSGPSWDEPVLLGITRPVRLLTLGKPLELGPFRFTRLAVRVPDRVDEAGRGPAIREAGEDDPAEVVVAANAKGRQPVYSLFIPAAAVKRCATLAFDKVSKMIELRCRPQHDG